MLAAQISKAITVAALGPMISTVANLPKRTFWERDADWWASTRWECMKLPLERLVM